MGARDASGTRPRHSDGGGARRAVAQQLYDLSDDLSETNDLAAQMPDKVAELAKRMDDHLAAVDARLPGHL